MLSMVPGGAPFPMAMIVAYAALRPPLGSRIHGARARAGVSVSSSFTLKAGLLFCRPLFWLLV